MDQYLIYATSRMQKVPSTRSSSDTIMRSLEEKKRRIKVVNITEEGRYGGPQSRIAKVAALLKDIGGCHDSNLPYF